MSVASVEADHVAPVAGTIELRSASDRVYEALRERILLGELIPGQRVHQEAISRELGVSRTPVREALGRLTADGLVDLLPQRGARVANPSREDLEAGYEARLVLEPRAASRAAERRDPTALAAMCEAIEDHRRSVSNAGRSYLASREFHLAVARGSGNTYLARFAETLWVGRLGLRAYALQRETRARAETAADEHAAIADAVTAGRPQEAERLMRAHITAALARFRQQQASAPESPTARH